MVKPIAVLISDVHYNIHTLKLADAAMRMAINKANELDVPLIVAGDLHDSKANLRGECVNAMIETFKTANLQPYILRGNHDALNEKSGEHSLNFFQDLAVVITEPQRYSVDLGAYTFILGYLIPYRHDKEELRSYLKTIPKGSRIIMHQGVMGSSSGEYFQDKSAIAAEDVADFRVISGHYHTRQTIKTGRPQKNNVGLFDYIGNPYTLSFSEAVDPEKGFQLLYEDGKLEFIPTGIRKHVILEVSVDKSLFYYSAKSIKKDDLVWVKLSGTREELDKVTRNSIKASLEGINLPEYFKFDLIPLDTQSSISNQQSNLSQEVILDVLIDSLPNTSDERKTRLKSVWKDLM